MKIETALQHLGLTTTATEADVKQAYRELVKIWHPDRFQNDERLNARTEAQLKIINEAKTVALAYLERHGHFLRVGQERQKEPAGPGGPGRQYRRPPPKPEPEPEPRKQQQKKKPEPEKEAEAEAPVEERIRPERTAGPSFQFGQNALIVLFIVLVLLSFILLLTTSLGESPMERMKAYTETPPVVDPLRKIMAEKDAREGRLPEAEESTEAPVEIEAEAVVDTFFTLGSDKEWVSFVQGPPLQIKGQLWRYGHSTIDFIDDKVVGWNSSLLNPLLVGMILPADSTYPYGNFTIGSRKDEVVALQGAPSILVGDLWNFGEAIVLFQDDTVVSYKNDMHNTLYAPRMSDPDRLSLITAP